MPNSPSNPNPKIPRADETLHVLRLSISSRALLLSLIFFWRWLLSPYDTSASLNPNCLSLDSGDLLESPVPESILFPQIGKAIEDSIVWDGVYYVRTAQCGYEYEQSYAFFPLLSICITILSRTVFGFLIPVLGYRAVLGLSAYALNNLAFCLSAVYFYRLSVFILKDSGAALRASTLFCFNPASIFYSSVYSESLYSLLSLGGIYHLTCGANVKAMLLLALSGSARSNGLLNAGYFCFQAMHQSYDAILHKKHPNLAVQVVLTTIIRTLFISAPFIAFQAFGFFNICQGRPSDELSSWCKSRVPYLYGYIQGHYWGVGFLRYFQLKQLPNFLLASPILSMAVYSIIKYVKLNPTAVFSLGFLVSPRDKNSAAVFYLLGTNCRPEGAQISDHRNYPDKPTDTRVRQRKQKSKEEATDSVFSPAPSNHKAVYSGKHGFSSILLLPFILHLGFLSFVALFAMHVQVATRLLSASPPLYWFASYLMDSPGTGRRWCYIIWAYCIAYILLGSLLFSNFYPFT